MILQIVIHKTTFLRDGVYGSRLALSSGCGKILIWAVIKAWWSFAVLGGVVMTQFYRDYFLQQVLKGFSRRYERNPAPVELINILQMMLIFLPGDLWKAVNIFLLAGYWCSLRAGVIRLHILGGIKQCKSMVILRVAWRAISVRNHGKAMWKGSHNPILTRSKTNRGCWPLTSHGMILQVVI